MCLTIVGLLCLLSAALRAKVAVAAADGSPLAPGVQEPVREHGAPSVHPKIPNSRLGRVASPHLEGREMDLFIEIDASKDWLEICVRPGARPSPSPATTRSGASRRELARAPSGPSRARGGGRLRDVVASAGRRAGLSKEGSEWPSPARGGTDLKDCPRRRQKIRLIACRQNTGEPFEAANRSKADFPRHKAAPISYMRA